MLLQLNSNKDKAFKPGNSAFSLLKRNNII